jgi:hypothetical protein
MKPQKRKKPKAPVVKDEVFAALYESAYAFYRASPWSFIGENHIFAFQDTSTGKIGYLSVLGEDGTFLGLSIYRGKVGLNSCLKEEETESAINKHDALVLEFIKKKDLDREEKKLLKKLDAFLSKEPLAPSFRSYLPEFQGWYLNEEEALFFLLALKCAVFHSEKCKNDPSTSASNKGERYLLYTPKEDSWQSSWHTPGPLSSSEEEITPLNISRIEGLKGLKLYRDTAWEASVFYTPSVIQDDARPYFAKVLMIVHQESLLVLQVKIADPGKSTASRLGDEILSAIETHKRLPAELIFNDKALFEGIKPLAKALGIQVTLASFLPATAPAQENLLDHIR